MAEPKVCGTECLSQKNISRFSPVLSQQCTEVFCKLLVKMICFLPGLFSLTITKSFKKLRPTNIYPLTSWQESPAQ